MSGFLLSLESLQAALGERTDAAAQKLHLMQGVQSGFEVSASGSQQWAFRGTVETQARASYWVSVDAEIDETGHVHHLSGQCDCAEPFPCQHAGALMIKAAYAKHSVFAAPTPKLVAAPAASEPELDADREISEWLDLFSEEPTQEKEPSTATDSKDIAVFVVAQRRVGHREALEMRCLWAKPLKRGGYSKPRDMGMADAAAHPGEVAEVIRLVQAMQRASNAFSYYGSAARGLLTGLTGELALRLASNCGRLFVAGDDEELIGPFTQAPDAPLAWQWKNDEQAPQVWRLTPQIAHRPDASLWQAGSFVWFDAAALQWGQLSAEGMSTARIQALMNLPPVAESSWLRHETALMRQLAGLPLPPIADPPIELRGTQPKARLRIAPSNAFERPTLGLATAQLQIDYRDAIAEDAPHAVLREPLIGHWAADASPVLISAASNAEEKPKRALLFRDLARERQWRDGLVSLGLQADRTGRYRSAQGLAPHEQPWLAWADESFAAFEQLGIEVDASAMQGWVAHAQSLSAQISGDEPGEEASSQWFELSLGIQVGDFRVNVLPVLPALLAALQRADVPPFVHVPHPQAPDTRWLRVPTAALTPWVRTLLELTAERRSTLGESLRVSNFELMRMGTDLGEGMAWEGADRIRDLLAQLQAAQLEGHALPQTPMPQGLAAELRPYQHQGLNWLQFLRRHHLGGILADDMGLGKTLQTLAHILAEKEAGKLIDPVLIVCPVSVLGNWRREAQRFAPSLRVQVVHGLDRHVIDTDAKDLDIVVAPYSLLQRDRERWLKRKWSVLVLDEAQHIKNASTQAAKVVQDIKAAQRLCLTGTPLENHLGELWSLFHFVMPGFLGSASQFKSNFRTPIEMRADLEQLDRLRRRITPFILRRTKAAVAIELPPKVETIQPIALSGKQADLYETIRLSTEQSVRDALAEKGLARSQIQVLDALLKLRQVCCDPRLVPSQRGKSIAESAKLERLMDLLPELIEEGRKVLLFSQFTSMLSLIEEALAKQGGIRWVKLTGESKNREAIIEQFTSGEVPLFLISLKAGGTGLNLQAADTVIHYDPWWNPAVENQATDRAHRIGQTQQVMVYKLVAEGTIEERMLALQARKAELADGVLSGSHERKEAMFTESDLQELLRPLDA